MVPVTAALLAACLSVINITLAVRGFLRERRDRREPKPHALTPALADIAAAIRERGPDLHVRLGDVPTKPGTTTR